MSADQPILPVAPPDLRALLNAQMRQTFASLNCHQVGEVVAFDPAAQTATVKLATNKQVVDYRRRPPQFVYVPYPLLTDCPVMFCGGGTGRLTFPVAPGDQCLVLFNDRDLDNWFDGGANTPPNSDRQHDLSDGLVLVGFRNRAGALADFYEDGAELAFEGGRVRVADKLAFDGLDSTLRTVLQKVKDALTALNLKTGPSAATEIAAVQTELDKLLQ